MVYVKKKNCVKYTLRSVFCLHQSTHHTQKKYCKSAHTYAHWRKKIEMRIEAWRARMLYAFAFLRIDARIPMILRIHFFGYFCVRACEKNVNEWTQSSHASVVVYFLSNGVNLTHRDNCIQPLRITKLHLKLMLKFILRSAIIMVLNNGLSLLYA